LGPCSAKDLADMYSIPQEALAKILQRLNKGGLLASQYGTNGGYTLARDPRKITAYEVTGTSEGPGLRPTYSSEAADGKRSARCAVREPLRKVSRTIEEVLNK